MHSVIRNQVLRQLGSNDGAGTSTGGVDDELAGVAGVAEDDPDGARTKVLVTSLVDNEVVVRVIVEVPDVMVLVTGQVVTSLEMMTVVEPGCSGAAVVEPAGTALDTLELPGTGTAVVEPTGAASELGVVVEPTGTASELGVVVEPTGTASELGVVVEPTGTGTA